MGAGLFAANLSTTFRLRKFGMADKVPYQIKLRMEGGEAGGEGANGRTALRCMGQAEVAAQHSAAQQSSGPV